MQGNLIFTDHNGNILPEDDEEDENYEPDKEDQEDIPLVLLNNPNDLDNELNEITGVDDIPEDDKEDNEYLAPQDPEPDNNEPAE